MSVTSRYKATTKDGFTITCEWSIAPVMANCGMRALSNFSFYAQKAEDSWTTSWLREEELEKLFKKHASMIVRAIVKSTGRYMLVLSDQMLKYSGLLPSIEHCIVTRDLMNYIVANKVGSYSLGPVFRNNNYGPGESDIQSMVWVPPALCKHIILPAPKPYNSRHKRDVTYATVAAAARASGIAKGKK